LLPKKSQLKNYQSGGRRQGNTGYYSKIMFTTLSSKKLLFKIIQKIFQVHKTIQIPKTSFLTQIGSTLSDFKDVQNITEIKNFHPF